MVEIPLCRRLDTLSRVLPGWGCCKCNCYNGYQRLECRSCGHLPCYPVGKNELLPAWPTGTQSYIKPAASATVVSDLAAKMSSDPEIVSKAEEGFKSLDIAEVKLKKASAKPRRKGKRA